MNEKSTTPSKYNVDFLNNSYETIFSTKTEFVNKPIQMSSNENNHLFSFVDVVVYSFLIFVKFLLTHD